MGYALHIGRADEGAISEQDWRAAVAAVPALRFCDGTPLTTTNPRTGEKIAIGRRPTDVELRFPDDAPDADRAGRWIPVFWYSVGGRVTFKPPGDMDDPSDPVRAAASSLARALDAVIRGDDGEEYDW
jgi:hypothetical protein